MKFFYTLALFGTLAAAQVTVDIPEVSEIIDGAQDVFSSLEDKWDSLTSGGSERWGTSWSAITASIASEASEFSESIASQTSDSSTTITETSVGTATSTVVSTSEIVSTSLQTITTTSGDSIITRTTGSVVTSETVISSETEVETTETNTSTSPNAAPTRFVAAGAVGIAVGGWVLGNMV